MSSFSFVHLADLHLDSPFATLSGDNPDLAASMRSATFEAFDTSDKIKGFTGSGYVTVDRHKGSHSVDWTFTAPNKGRYVLEFRYVNDWSRDTDLVATINGQNAGHVRLWNSGTAKTWVWDRMIVDLQKGANTISIKTGGRILVDHVNVLYAGPN